MAKLSNAPASTARPMANDRLNVVPGQAHN
jgi:hypothetical protein